MGDGVVPDEDDGIARELWGFEFPEWVVGMQLSLQAASERVDLMIQVEYNAAVWNCTKADEALPVDNNPATFPDSPELVAVGSGFDFATSVCEGVVLSPCLFQSFLKYADPLYTPGTEEPIVVKKKPVKPAIPESDAIDVSSETSQSSTIASTDGTVRTAKSFNDGGLTEEEEGKMLLN